MRIHPISPIRPIVKRQQNVRCSSCGVDVKDVVGYVCSNRKCPVQVAKYNGKYNE
jgi:hypothetical protein